MYIFGKKRVFLKTKTLIAILSVFLFLGAQKIKAEDEEKIRINELIPNPSGSDTENEYIELYNFGDKDVDVEGWILADADRKDKDKMGKTKKINGVIKGGDFLEIKNSVSLNNDWDTVFLTDSSGKELDRVDYNESIEGFSYSFDGEEWKWSSILTGGNKNEFDKEKEWGKKIIITEFLPNPSGDENKDEFIELYNDENKEVDLSGWTLKDDGSKKGYLIKTDLVIKSKKYIVIYRKDFDFALNNSGDENIFLIDPKNTIVDSAKYNGCKENVSYNFDGKKWRQSKFLTPGEENKFNNLPQVKIEVEDVAYQDIYADFEVKAKDKDKDELKITWDFGDGHKSYLEKTRHKYEKTGKYFASVKVFDGSEDVIKNFSVVVEKYPRMEMKIVEIMPNPEGLDSEGEWILVKNASKKTVNLKGWSVATGISEKKLVNHPIYNSIKIKPGETEKITRKDSYFSLGNKQAYIELRYPDGKVAYSLKYKEKDSIKDNSTFQKEKGKRWEWILQEVEGDDNEQLSIIDEQWEADNNQQVVGADNQTAAGDNITEGENTNSIYAGKTTQKPVEIEISPEIYKKLVELENENKASEIFGEFSIRQEEEKYFFTSKTAFSEHYAKKFLEELTQKINTFLNSLFI
jgi:hypothetical protein